jgi:hypothetical protein
VLRIEGAPDPLQHLVVLRVGPVANRGETVCITPYSAAILRGAGARSGYAPRIDPALIELKRPFNADLVLPAIAEIIFVDESGLLSGKRLGERRPMLIANSAA